MRWAILLALCLHAGNAPLAPKRNTIEIWLFGSELKRVERMMRIINHAYFPPKVAVRLSIITDRMLPSAPLTFWKHGRFYFVKKARKRLPRSALVIVLNETMDISPFFAYWFWRARARYGDNVTIAGSMDLVGFAPAPDVWRRGGDLGESLRGHPVVRPPYLDGGTFCRAEIQDLLRPEREPKLVRTWRELFLEQATVTLYYEYGAA